MRSRMNQTVSLVASDISSIRTGRASGALVENIVVNAYGGTQKLKVMELSTISTPDPQSIIIDPWDKSIIGEIRQAIVAANVGLNPIIDQERIRVSVPPMTGEDREKYTKLLSTKIENGKISIRQVRADFMHSIKKAFESKEITEDEKFNQEKTLQEITDKYVEDLSQIENAKKQELLQI